MNNTSNLEALVNAIGYLHKYHEADSEAYKLRNPMLLKSHAKPGKHVIDSEGRRVFESFQGGYLSAIFDLKIKLSGESNSGIIPDKDLLKNLLAVYGVNRSTDIDTVVYFLREALSDSHINISTPLSYFKGN